MNSEFEIKYAGPALDTGAINVKALAPSLLAFANLVDEANKACGNQNPINLQVKGNKNGSHVVEFLLSNWEYAKNLFTQSTAQTLLAIPGAITGLIVIVQYAKLIK